MKALILAAGRGRRMKGLTEEQPKALLKVGGQPLLRHALNTLSEVGIKQLGIVTGYRSDLLKWPEFSVSFHNAEWEKTNMVYSLFKAAAWMRESDTILCYSDILFTSKTIEALIKAPGDIVVSNNVNWQDVWAMRFANPLDDAETFKRSESGRLTEIGQKPKSLADIQGQYMGLIKISTKGWRDFESLQSSLPSEQFAKIDMTSTLNQLIQRDVPIQTVDVHEHWYEFDSEEDLRSYL